MNKVFELICPKEAIVLSEFTSCTMPCLVTEEIISPDTLSRYGVYIAVPPNIEEILRDPRGLWFHKSSLFGMTTQVRRVLFDDQAWYLISYDATEEIASKCIMPNYIDSYLSNKLIDICEYILNTM